MTKAALRKLGGYYDVTDTVIALFDSICQDHVEIPSDTILVEQGGDYGDVYLMEGGWVIRARHLENGSRQIVNTAMPGDFVALNALLFTQSDFELRTRTPVSAFRFRAEDLNAALRSDARLAAALFWVNAHEESLLAERIVSLGRRTARQRVAHVLSELIARLEIIGIDDMEQMLIPISQEDFSDILGISIVHTNKTLRALSRDEIISFRNTVLLIKDRARLEAEAGFDDGYLHFTRRNDRSVFGLPLS